MSYILKSDIWGQTMPINQGIGDPQEPDEDDLSPDEMSPRADTEEGAIITWKRNFYTPVD